jgi:hypothetical protein
MDAEQIKNVTEIVLQVVGVCSVIAAATPNPVDNAVLIIVRQIIDFGALNWWNAENLKKPGKK